MAWRRSCGRTLETMMARSHPKSYRQRQELALATMDAVRKGEGEGRSGAKLTQKESNRELPPPHPPREVSEKESMEGFKCVQRSGMMTA